MNRFVPIAIAFVVVLYAFIDVLQSRGSDVRTFPRWVWALVVVLLPVLGAIGWFILGRPRRAAAGGGPGRRRGPVAPDDDPAFLRELQDKAWSERMKKRRERPASTGSAGAAGSSAARGGEASRPADDASGDAAPGSGGTGTGADQGGADGEGSGTSGPAVDSGSPGPAD